MERSSFGVGIYTVPEAARMVGMRAPTLRRWLLGYDHDDKREAPLWHPQYQADEEDGVLLGFRDLVEARIVNALRERRIGLQTIRVCVERARDTIGQDRPFSTSEFKTDGKNIFLRITRNLDEPQLFDLRRSQGVFDRVVAPSLQDLDFGEDGAKRWWLLDGKRTIVADPTRAFGQPIIASHGITTARVAEAVEAEGTVSKVARIYEIKPALIRDALRYESRIASPLAA